MNRVLSVYLCIVFVAMLAACGGKSGRTDDSLNSRPADTGKAIITFVNYEHDFGRVKEGEKVGCIFTFSNMGTSDLLISSAVTSCGCTVPKYAKKPLSPGSSGTMEVLFDTSGRNGIQTKTISVHSNAATPVVVLMIKAEVISNN